MKFHVTFKVVFSFHKLVVSRAGCLLGYVTRSIRDGKMASQTQGIQQLLAAEKRAAEKVAEARKRKARRLKQAKEEAQDEIEKYRQEREKQFKEFEAKHMGSKEDVAARIEADAKGKIDEMNRAVEIAKDPVIKQILNLVYDIKPQMHKNFKVKA